MDQPRRSSCLRTCLTWDSDTAATRLRAANCSAWRLANARTPESSRSRRAGLVACACIAATAPTIAVAVAVARDAAFFKRHSWRRAWLTVTAQRVTDRAAASRRWSLGSKAAQPRQRQAGKRPRPRYLRVRRAHEHLSVSRRTQLLPAAPRDARRRASH